MISDKLKTHLIENSFPAIIPSNKFYCLITEEFLHEITEWFEYYQPFMTGFDKHLVANVISCETRYFELDVFKMVYFTTRGITSNNSVMVELSVADTDFSIDVYKSEFSNISVRLGRIYMSLYNEFKRLKTFIFYPKIIREN